MKCFNNHDDTSFSVAGLRNKLIKYEKKNDISSFCKHCKVPIGCDTFLKDIQKEILEKNGHKVQKIIGVYNDGKKKLSYICGNCNTENQSDAGNIRKSTGVCSNCQHESVKRTFDDVQKDLDPYGFVLLKYKNNKQAKIKCNKEHTFTTTINNVNRNGGGYGCPQCADGKLKNKN